MQKSVEWMTPKYAARIWHVSERTARRYFDDLGAPMMRVPDETGKVRLRRVLPVGTQPPFKMAGNPHFSKPEYQRDLAERRWDGHITPDMKAAYDQYMFELQRDQFLAGIELGMPPDPEEDEF